MAMDDWTTSSGFNQRLADLRPSSLGWVRVDSKAGVLSEVCAALAVGDPDSAKEKLRDGYPFEPVVTFVRRYSERDSMKLFMRDGFIDRYC